MSLTSPALVGRFFTTSTTWEAIPYSLRSSNFTSMCMSYRNLSTCEVESMHLNVHRSTFIIVKKINTAEMLIKRRLDKYILMYSYNRKKNE